MIAAALPAREPADTPREWWTTPHFAAGVLLLSALPLLWPAVPPLADLPGHMAQYRIMLGTDADVLGRWYGFGWRPVGNLGVDLLVAALAPVIGLEPATKLIVIATPMVAATGMLWLSREAHGRVQPTALFALPLAYNYAFHFGFVNFTLAAALALSALALWMRLGRTGRTGLRAAIFVPLSVLLWLAHLFGWAILGVLAFGVELDRRRGAGLPWPRALTLAAFDCLPLAPPVAAFLLWRPAGAARAGDWASAFLMKPGWLVMILRDRWKLFDVASVAVIATLIYAGWRSPRFATNRALATSAGLLFAAFVALPFMHAYADMRIAPYAAVVALLVVAPASAMPARERRLLALAGLAFFAARTFAATASLALDGRQWEQALAVLDHIPRGSRVAALVELDCTAPWAPDRRTHLPSMAVVRRAAFTNDGFAMGADALVTLRIKGPFTEDPSQLAYTPDCATGTRERTLADALAELPRNRFDYLWLLPRGEAAPHPGLIPVAQAGGTILYRIRS